MRVGVASCWVAALACGGVTQRNVDGESGGSGAAGSSSKAGNVATAGTTSAAAGTISAAAGTSSAAAGTSSAAAGTSSAAAGTSGMIPMPTPEPASCFHDTDCPGSACGGQVCNWNLAHPNPVGDKVFVCNAAGSQPKGVDGWCTTDENCKCASRGAKCAAPYCTFTR
jgi:hypothetical protein